MSWVELSAIEQLVCDLLQLHGLGDVEMLNVLGTNVSVVVVV